jgi:voltage-gated potassium channel
MIQQLLLVFMRRLIVTPPITFRALALLAAIVAYGTTGFLYFELPGNPDLTVSDALWYSFVTMTTVGYGDFFPKTTGGRYLVGVPLMLVGIGLLGYVLSVIATALVTARTKEIRGMSDFRGMGHLLVINYPGLAKVERVLAELANDPAIGRHVAVVLVDEQLEELPPELASRQVRFVRGNPARDETLARANVKDAAHAVVLARRPGDPHSDALNLAVVLAIEGRNRNVNTVVECVDAASEELLRKAGCDRIVCTSRLDACFVGQELLNPGMQDVVEELLTNAGGQQLYLTPVQFGSGATFADLARSAGALGHIALGIRRGTETRLNVAGGTMLATGDIAITVGAERPRAIAVTA